MIIKKIGTKEEAEKKKRKNQIIIGGVLVFIMIISSLGYAFIDNKSTDTTTSQKYGAYKFTQSGQFWQLNIQNQNFYFQYLPQETDNVSINGNFALSDYSGKPLYIVNTNPAAQEITNNLGKYALRIQEACLTGADNSSVCTNLPIKDCSSNLIVFLADNSSNSDAKVWKQNNCTYISGDLMKASDAFVYRILGIK